MTSGLTETLRVSTQKLIIQGLYVFEAKHGAFKVESQQTKFSSTLSSIFLEVLTRIEANEVVSIFPMKPFIIEAAFNLDLDAERTILVVEEFWQVVVQNLKSNRAPDEDLIQELETYKRLIVEALSNLELFIEDNVTQFLQTIPEYQYAEEQYSFKPVEVDYQNNKIYTLFEKSRYWEEFRALDDNSSYTLLSYNKVARKLGLQKFSLSFSYEDLVINDSKLYKLRPGVGTPTRRKFIEEEWTEFSPRTLDLNRTFSRAYDTEVKNMLSAVVGAANSINEVTSDSHIAVYNGINGFDWDSLQNTFGGEGESLHKSIQELRLLSEYMGGYEGSPVGAIDYTSEFVEYFFSAAFGHITEESFELVKGGSAFGQFSTIFESQQTEAKIPGLSFLSGFSKLRSFAHGQELLFAAPATATTVVFNPLSTEFFNGIKDFYEEVPNATGYVRQVGVDLLLLSLETLYSKCLFIGDIVEATRSSLDSRGILPGYEGLGAISPQMYELQKVFPPSRFLTENQREKILPGLSGAVRYLMSSYARISRAALYRQFPKDSFETLPEWLESTSNAIERVVSQLVSIGLGKNAFIPNISFKKSQAGVVKSAEFLRSIGLSESEVQILLSTENFSELVTKFAPLTDSRDLKSFFKAYELAQMIYEFSGDGGVNAYLEFLYSKSSIDSLLNILKFAQKEKSKITSMDVSRFPRLIGLLIGMVFAVDPSQLVKFDRLLGSNNLSLLESVEFLLQSDQNAIIKSKDDIELLGPVIKHIVQRNYVNSTDSDEFDYTRVKNTAPIGLKQWTEQISRNAGNVGDPKLLEGLYDKAVGLTPLELITILNPPESSTELAGLVDGFSGGNFTKFLRYANLAGISLKLSYYNNSYQTNNFKVTEAAPFFGFSNIVSGLKDVVNVSRLVQGIFSSYVELRDIDPELPSSILPLIYAQNKPADVLAKVIEGTKPGTQTSLAITENSVVYRSISGNAPIVEPPGIGNSRTFNRAAAVGSITSEQAEQIFSGGSAEQQFEVARLGGLVNVGSLVNRFFKFSTESTLSQRIAFSQEAGSQSGFLAGARAGDGADAGAGAGADFGAGAGAGPGPGQPAAPGPAAGAAGGAGAGAGASAGAGAEVDGFRDTSPPPVPYTLPERVRAEELRGKEVITPFLGASYIAPPTQTYKISDLERILPRGTSFTSQIDYCRRFGGENCEKEYKDSEEVCNADRLNKSLKPQQYNYIPVSSGGVPIDRPPGTFAQLKPRRTIVPTSMFDRPPSYFTLLPPGSVPGPGGEPLLPSILETPLVFDETTGATSEFANTETALLEFIRAKLEKSTEFSCASFSSPYKYQVCMNVMKCKRLSPPYEGTFFHKFCPKVLSGGRLK